MTSGEAEELSQEVKKTDLVQVKLPEESPADRGLSAVIATAVNIKYSLIIGAIIIALSIVVWRVLAIIRKKKKQ